MENAPSAMTQEYKGQKYRVCFPGQAYDHEPALVFYADDGSIALSRKATAEELMAYESKELLRNMDFNISYMLERLNMLFQYPLQVTDVGRR